MAIFGLLSNYFADVVQADMVHSPVRMRFNSGLVKKIFHQGDHQLLANFSDMDVGQVPPIPKVAESESENEEASETQVEIPEAIVSDLRASIVPKHSAWRTTT